MGFSPKLCLSGAEGKLTEPALSLLLDMLTRWNLFLHRAGARIPPLYESGVRYCREDYGGCSPEDWLDALEVLRRGNGDCEDLATYRAAELQAKGENARCVFVEKPLTGGGRLFHIFVQRASGQLEDPSRTLGMTF